MAETPVVKSVAKYVINSTKVVKKIIRLRSGKFSPEKARKKKSYVF